MERVILHCDLNSFYASVECLHNDNIRDKPVAVCGDPHLRHGIVLSKNEAAKALGVKTGDIIRDAKQKAPNLVTVVADFEKYLRFSMMVKEIYKDYTDRVESFGIDEVWLDIGQCDGRLVADDIRARVKAKTGCTLSVGVSWNKIFAKLGSDLKKPDATTVISKENYKEKVWKLPVENLLYVGKATKSKLNKRGVKTIGELAAADKDFLKRILGKWGEYLWVFANGYDCSPVKINGVEDMVKSVGNSSTAHRDLYTESDILMLMTVLSESVASRLKKQGLKGFVVSISVRDKNLKIWGRQVKLDIPVNNSAAIIRAAMNLFKYYDFSVPVRSAGVKVSSLVSSLQPEQLSFFTSGNKCVNPLEKTIEEIRSRFGHFSINRGVEYMDTILTGMDPEKENVIHPVGFF